MAVTLNVGGTISPGCRPQRKGAERYTSKHLPNCSKSKLQESSSFMGSPIQYLSHPWRYSDWRPARCSISNDSAGKERCSWTIALVQSDEDWHERISKWNQHMNYNEFCVP